MSKIILTQEVSGLGSPGDVVEVKGGYARNYLVPTGRATPWSRGAEKQVEVLRSARAGREAASLEDAQQRKQRLEAQPIRLAVRTGQTGRLFGSVSAVDVAQAVDEAGFGPIDRRTVEILSPIRQTGSHEVLVRLRSDVTASLTVEVVGGR